MTTLLLQSMRLTLAFTVLLGLAYPLVVTGIAQLAFHRKANGSLERRGDRVVGSELLAQKFESPRYFWQNDLTPRQAMVGWKERGLCICGGRQHERPIGTP